MAEMKLGPLNTNGGGGGNPLLADGGEGGDVAGHARHEAGDERGNAEAQQARPGVTRQHERQDFVVAM